MTNLQKSVLAMLLSFSLMAVTACGGRGGATEPDIIDEYEQAMRAFPGSSAAIDQGLARFKTSYADLTDPALAERIRATYAERLFFNDTLHSFGNLEDLVAYMEKTGAGLSSSRIEVHQLVRDDADVFVRWSMEFKTRAAGREIHSRSIGMTHLRFDEDGRIVLHQDFWDSGHALYAHLPFVGFAVRRARSAM